MNIKALITAFAILGSSSVAMARPATVSASVHASASWSVGQRTPTVTVRDHRRPTVVQAPLATHVPYGDRYDGRWGAYEPRYQPQPVRLSGPMSFGTTEYRKDVYPTTNDRFSRVAIEGTSGQTFVQLVKVQFTDLEWKFITVNETIRAGEAIELPLDTSKAIKRILVYRADGEAAHNLNQAQRGSFLVSAL